MISRLASDARPASQESARRSTTVSIGISLRELRIPAARVIQIKAPQGVIW